MVELKRSLRIALNVLAKRFPDLNRVKLSAQDVDVWQPKYLQLESIGILRNFSDIQDLQNTDPDTDALQDWLEKSECLKAVDFKISVDKNLYHSEVSGDCYFDDDDAVDDDTVDHDYIPANETTKKRQRPQSSSHVTKLPRRNISHTVSISHSRLQLPQAVYQPVQGARAIFNPATRRFTPNLPDTLSGKARQKLRKHQHHKWSLYQRHSRNTEVHLAKSDFHVEEDGRISKPAWMGTNMTADVRQKITEAIDDPNPDIAKKMLSGITLIPYVMHKAAAVCDAAGRMFFYRSALTQDMIRQLLPQVNVTAQKFVDSIKHPFSEDNMLRNSRGHHWFSIAGHDRNNKEVPKASKFQQANDVVITEYFKPGSVFQRLTAFGCTILEAQFPAIAERYKESIKYMNDTYGIEAKFGLFFNFCLNSPRNGVKRVFCKPHVDWKNVAFGVCMIFIYGHFNHCEKCWLVIWEAGLAFELPPGVFALYPSSLFLHFNVDLCHLPIVTTPNGERPTKENSTPLYFCDHESHDDDEAWQRADGRGSMVWFNQASMVQTSELGVSTLKLAKELGMETTCDASVWMKKDIFPMQVIEFGHQPYEQDELGGTIDKSHSQG
ncbi:hypothetical protein BT96DRAFT_999823 [Gymnopus androsaceus JB14]|uniref:Uncharacterized protein n=1 Tax=Gymnopus androsaceus JB14 TaxID=1447944 RepID=A0A6A4H4C1_9AGAR|nr:hypothetical protein BT96DRAFT_999823 [Gymnopus androsaceus JB14]